MKIQPATLLKAEDFPALMAASKGEAEKLFRAINVALSSIVLALTHGLTFADNFQAFTKTITVDGSVNLTPSPPIKPPAQFTNTLSGAPAFVLPVRATAFTTTAAVKIPTQILPPSGAAWSLDKDQIVLSSLGTLDATKTYQITFLIVGA